jgi:cytochrome P450
LLCKPPREKHSWLILFVGPIFRYGPNSLSFNTSSANQTINAPKANCQKSRFYEGFPPVKGAWSIVSAIPRDVHARKRRVLSHAFSDKALRNMESFILPQVRTFCELLAESGQKGKTMNMSKMSNYMSFDIMGDLCFGKTFSMQTREDNRFVTELISGRVRNDSVVRMPLFSIIQLSTSFISLKSLTDDMENEG